MSTNTTKHTPGPWWVAPNGTSIMCGNPGDPEIVATTAVGDIMGVCNRQRATMLGFDGRDSFDGWDESEANAALIAQAPALLARVAELEAANAALRAALESIASMWPECRKVSDLEHVAGVNDGRDRGIKAAFAVEVARAALRTI